MKQLSSDILPRSYTNKKVHKHQEHRLWSSPFTLNTRGLQSIQWSEQRKSHSQPHGFRNHETLFKLPQQHVQQIILDIWANSESTKHNFRRFATAQTQTLVPSCVFFCFVWCVCLLVVCSVAGTWESKHVFVHLTSSAKAEQPWSSSQTQSDFSTNRHSNDSLWLLCIARVDFGFLLRFMRAPLSRSTSDLQCQHHQPARSPSYLHAPPTPKLPAKLFCTKLLFKPPVSLSASRFHIHSPLLPTITRSLLSGELV